MALSDQLQGVKDPQGFKFQGGNLGDVISTVLNYAFYLGGVALVLYFLFGGFQLFTSGGDQKKVAEGKTTITNAVVGFVIVFVAFWIVQLIGSLLGISNLLTGSERFR